MLVLFIYLAIGGILLSGLLIARNEEIFDKDLRRSLKKDFKSLYDPHIVFFIFSTVMAAMMVMFWLPFVIVAIIYRIYDKS